MHVDIAVDFVLNELFLLVEGKSVDEKRVEADQIGIKKRSDDFCLFWD